MVYIYTMLSERLSPKKVIHLVRFVSEVYIKS